MKITPFLRVLLLLLGVATATPSNISLTSDHDVNSTSSIVARGHSKFVYHYNIASFDDQSLYMVRSGWRLSNYTVTGMSISPGQDPEGNNKVGSTFDIQHKRYAWPIITVLAGRHGTREVAQWWNERFPAEYNTFGHKAGKLNFAFIGELRGYVMEQHKPAKSLCCGLRPQGPSRPFVIPNVGIAQGHAHLSNNWWLGLQGGWPSRFRRHALDIALDDPAMCLTFRRGSEGFDHPNAINIDIHYYEECFDQFDPRRHKYKDVKGPDIKPGEKVPEILSGPGRKQEEADFEPEYPSRTQEMEDLYETL